MRIYTPAGDLAFKTFTFPDGQPHFKLETHPAEDGWTGATIETAIKSPSDLFVLQLASDTLRNVGYSELRLDIRYLLGARMDRAISVGEPHTLQTVARIINSCGFSKVRILDAHSEVATRLIRNSQNVLPTGVVSQVLATLGYPVVVVPDKGAIDRVDGLVGRSERVFCSKVRDMSTGALLKFNVDTWPYAVSKTGGEVIILDDICDGGGTFTGLAEELRKRGAKKVHLFVTHGIFSKGLPLKGIDRVFTTDSYSDLCTCDENHLATVIPISMKELK